MEQKHFSLNQESYEKNYKPGFNKDGQYNFKSVIQFLIVLPYELALSEDSIMSFPEEKEVYCFSFSRFEKEKSYSAGASKHSPSISYYESIVEMSLFTEKVYYLNENEASEVFDRLLKHLNHIVTAYLMKTKQTDVYRLSREMLEPFSLCRQVAIEDFMEQNSLLFFLHPNVVYKKETLDFPKQSEVFNFTIVVKKQENPFLLTEELMINGRRNIRSGFYSETVLHAQTSVETFLRTLYGEMLKIEGLTETEVSIKQGELGFITMVKREFSNRIGGSWNIKSPRKEVGFWHDNCYKLRNRVIHGGYQPSFSETSQAIDAAQKLREFVVGRLKRSQKFKELAQYL